MIHKNKIIIFTFSKVGIQIAKSLQLKNYKVLIVDNDDANLQKAKSLGYETYKSSLMEDESIYDLKIDSDPTIKAFFCVSEDKNINLFVTLSVRNINQDLKIVSIAFSKEDNKVMHLAGANKVVNPYEIGALRIFRLLHKPFILEVLDGILFSESNIEVSEITIQPNTILDGVFLSDLNIINRNDIVILGIQDQELSHQFTFFSQGINHKIDAGDTLVVLGPKQEIKEFKQLINNMI